MYLSSGILTAAPTPTVQSYLLRAAESVEQVLAKQGLSGGQVRGSVVFTGVGEKQLYRLFIIDYFFMQLAAVRPQDTALRMSLAASLADLLQNPPIEILQALQPLLAHQFEFPMLRNAGVSVNSTGSISLLTSSTGLDFTPASRTAIAAGLVRLASAESHNEQLFIAQKWAEAVTAAQLTDRTVPVLPTPVLVEPFTQAAIGEDSSVHALAAIAAVKAEGESIQQKPSNVATLFYVGAQVRELFELENPTLLDWYSYSVGWLVDSFVERRRVRDSLTQVQVIKGVDSSSSALELQMGLTDLALGRLPITPLPLALNAAIAPKPTDQLSGVDKIAPVSSPLFVNTLSAETSKAS